MKEKRKIQPQQEEWGQIDGGKLLSNSLQHWYLFVTGILLCIGIAYLYLRYTTPIYNISSTLLIKDNKNGPDMSGGTVFSEMDFFKSSSNIDNEIEVLKSKTLMQRVLKELALETSYYVEGAIRDHEIYGKDLPIKVITAQLDSAAFEKTLAVQLKDNQFFKLEETGEDDSLIVTTYRFGQRIKKPYGVFSIVKKDDFEANAGNKERKIILRFHDINKLAAYYNEILAIAPVNKNASVITLNLMDPLPEKGQDIINKLIDVYLKEGVEDKNHIATNTISFLDERLQFLTEELSKVENDVEKYKRQNEVANVSIQAQSYVNNASEYKKALTDWNIQIEVLNSIEDYIEKQGDKYELVPSTLGIKDGAVLGLISKFNEMQLERGRLLSTVQPNSPLIQNLDVQLKSLRVSILENLRNIKNDLLITRNSLQASSGQYAARIQEVPSIERDLLEINRQQEIKQGLYLYLLQKREESALSLAATVSNIRIIDPAIAGAEPASPKKAIVLFIALILGAGFPLAFVYVKDLLNDKVQDRKDIELLTNTPVLGEISQNKTKNTLVVTENSRTPIAELFRLARINLNFSTVGKENKIIMVTSSMSGEGKTFFAINLSSSMALAGKKVVLVDLDLRKPKVLADLGFPNDKGVTNYVVSQNVSLDEIIRPIEPRFFVVGTGHIPPNPAEFMLSPRLGKLINDLKETFDYVVIDTAPIGLVSDPFILAPLVDSTIYVVRRNYTFKGQLEIINEIYSEKKLKNPMVILNDTKKETKYGYGYGDTKVKGVGRKKVNHQSQPLDNINYASANRT